MDLFDLLEPDPPAQRHSATSVDAADAIRPQANRLRAVVWDAIRAAGMDGLTDEEIQERLNMVGNTARPRRRELQLAGRVRDSGKTRPTRRGRKAVVWVANDQEKSNG